MSYSTNARDQRRPRRCGARSVILIAAVGIAAAIGANSGQSAATPVPALSGAFAGGPSATTDFGTWRGAPIQLAHAFAQGGTWSDIELPLTFLNYWASSPYRSEMMISIPMLPSSQSASLEQGATGAYNAYWRTAAQRLVQVGMGNATLRIGWELNGGWFKWSAKSDPSAWAAYFRQIVDAMRSVPGQSFQFVWSVSNGYYGWDPRTAYPGNAYVDYIGVGLYDCWYQHPATPQDRWNFLVNWTGKGKPAGLAFWTNYAASLGKPLVIPEWGLVDSTASMCGGSGGGADDPYFVQQVDNWVVTHNVAWQMYFNSDAPDGSHRLDTGLYPSAAAAYQQLFGSYTSA